MARLLRSLTALVFLTTTGWVQAQRQTVLEGTITNAGTDRVEVNKVGVPVGSDGHFRWETNLTGPLYVRLDLAPGYLFYLRPGDRLSVQWDTRDVDDSISAEGDGAALNRYLIDEAKRSASRDGYFREHADELFAMGELEFLSKLKELRELELSYLEHFFEEHPDLDAYFVHTQQAANQYPWANALLSYIRWHPLRSAEKSYVPTGPAWSLFRSLSFNDEALLDFDWYRAFLEGYLGMNLDLVIRGSSSKNDPYPGIREGLRILEKGIERPHIRDFLLPVLLPGSIEEYDLTGSEKVFRKLSEAYSDRRLGQQVEQEVRSAIDESRAVRSQCRTETYKKVGHHRLLALVFRPEGFQRSQQRPALAYFHGGGWERGRAEWGAEICRHFASLGMVAVSFEYRLRTEHGSNPSESVADARSAIRWLRLHAEEMGIDPDRIVAAGRSAGGHLAASTALLPGPDEVGENRSVSAAPNALLLWSAAVDVGDDAWFRRILPADLAVETFNPAEYVRAGLPPSALFQGGADETVRPDWTRAFAERMTKSGNRCELHVYQREGHVSWSDPDRRDVYEKMEAFLGSLDFLPVRATTE